MGWRRRVRHGIPVEVDVTIQVRGGAWKKCISQSLMRKTESMRDMYGKTDYKELAYVIMGAS